MDFIIRAEDVSDTAMAMAVLRDLVVAFELVCHTFAPAINPTTRLLSPLDLSQHLPLVDVRQYNAVDLEEGRGRLADMISRGRNEFESVPALLHLGHDFNGRYL